MPPLCVLEFVRSSVGIWNLPRVHVEDLEREFPEVRFQSPADQAEADRMLPDADVVFGWAVNPKNFDSARRLRWIQLNAAGVGSALFSALIESDVVVTNGRGLHAVSMAEHTIGVMLAFARKLHLARDAQRDRRWAQDELWRSEPDFRHLAGTTLGLFGFGAVGSALAERARALGVRVVAVRKHPARDPAPADEQWGADRFDELIEQSDWLVLASALTPETHGIITRDRLARMPGHAVLINLGRGALVDEAALIDTLEAGGIAGAALDVLEREPLPATSPLWGMPQVIVTPHISGFGPRHWERAVDLFRRNLRAFGRGDPLENVVDKRAGY